MIALIAAVLLASPSPGPQSAIDLRWMEGVWRACDAGSETVETWTHASEGLLFGHSTTRRGGRLTEWEQLRIIARGGVTVYQAMPNGRDAVDFMLVDQSPQGAIFQNRDNDWPNVIVYEREGDVMTATIRGLDGAHGPVMSWAFQPGDQTSCD
jgi:hypothetical protein